MLGVKSYPKAYIAACQARVKAQVASYRKLAKAAPASAVKAFEPEFFNNMVLTLDSYFMHRLRGLELKDGNPCNEVRVVCTSLLENGGIMTADKGIKLIPEQSVLKIEYGTKIKVTEADFGRLADAYFAEVEKKFS